MRWALLKIEKSLTTALSIALIAMTSCNPVAGHSAEPRVCTPFGAPPAERIYAVKPNCGKGQLLGPWNDADGTARYACIYRPSVVTPDRKLPMVVYVHPSLFAAGW